MVQERRLLKEAVDSHAFVGSVPKHQPLFSGRILLLVSWHFSLPEIPLAWVWGFPDSLPDPAVISAPLRPQLLRAVRTCGGELTGTGASFQAGAVPRDSS